MNKLLLEQESLKNLSKFPKIEKYLKKAIIRQLKSKKSLTQLLEIPLIRYLGTAPSWLTGFESNLGEKDFTNIEVPIRALQTNLVEEWQSVMAELETAKQLKEEGFTNIIFLSRKVRGPDIQYIDKGRVKFAEVKSLKNLSPEFYIMDNKLSTQSIINPDFRKYFRFSCDFDLSTYSSISNLHKELELAIDNIIVELAKIFTITQIYEGVIKEGKFSFEISAKENKAGYFLMHSGNAMVYSSPADVFFHFRTIYSRILNDFKDGYDQLLIKRNGNRAETADDRLYFYLNVDGYKNFISDEATQIFLDFSRSLGMDKLVNIKFIL